MYREGSSSTKKKKRKKKKRQKKPSQKRRYTVSSSFFSFHFLFFLFSLKRTHTHLSPLVFLLLFIAFYFSWVQVDNQQPHSLSPSLSLSLSHLFRHPINQTQSTNPQSHCTPPPSDIDLSSLVLFILLLIHPSSPPSFYLLHSFASTVCYIPHSSSHTHTYPTNLTRSSPTQSHTHHTGHIIHLRALLLVPCLYLSLPPQSAKKGSSFPFPGVSIPRFSSAPSLPHSRSCITWRRFSSLFLTPPLSLSLPLSPPPSPLPHFSSTLGPPLFTGIPYSPVPSRSIPLFLDNITHKHIFSSFSDIPS